MYLQSRCSMVKLYIDEQRFIYEILHRGYRMQYLKDEVKNRIAAAALDEFGKKGYQEASMREIACGAGIATGNIYRYFKNKDELFNHIMEPVYSQFKSLVLTVAKQEEPSAGIYDIPIGDIADKVMDVFGKYGTQFLIMIDKSKGSKFENIKEELIKLVDRRLKEELLQQFERNGVRIEDGYITYVLASSIIEGLLIIIRKYRDNARIKYLVGQLLVIYFKNIVERMM